MNEVNEQPQAGLTHLHGEAYSALQQSAKALFQARKIGVIFTVPDDVRRQLIVVHGDEAKKLLDLVDGNVTL